MKKLSIFLVVLFSFMTFSVVIAPERAQAASAKYCSEEGAGFLSFPTWYKYLNPNPTADGCELTFDFPEDMGKVLLAIAEILLRVGGLVAVGFVIYGGFKFILSQGNSENAKNARTTIINALVGLAIAASATAIVNLIGGSLIK